MTASAPPSVPPAHPLLARGRRLVIGHRGSPMEAPENTLESFRVALAQGADALELDVHLSRDGVPVVIHDPDLRRTTDRAGLVERLTVAELQAADAGARFTTDGGRTFPWRGRGVRVPTLEEVVQAFPDTPLLVELKTPLVQDAVDRLLARHAAYPRTLPASAFDDALAVFRRRGVPYSASQGEIARLYFGAASGTAPRRVRYAALAVPYTYRGLVVPTPWFVRAAHRRDATVHVWTVDDVRVAARLWVRGVTGIVTNVPGVMVTLRDA